MDMKKLVVGQDVWVLVGEDIWKRDEPYTEKGKVVEVTARNVAVEFPGDGTWIQSPCSIRFDAVTGKAGTGGEGLGYFEFHGGCWMQSDPRSPGFWELTDAELAPGR